MSDHDKALRVPRQYLELAAGTVTVDVACLAPGPISSSMSAHDYTLSVSTVADHYALSPRTVRDWLQSGRLRGMRVGGLWRCRWKDVWAVEQGPTPRGPHAAAYRRPLLTKAATAARWGVSQRTIERWIAAGLPTRAVHGNTRIAVVDLEAWTRERFAPVRR